MTQPLSGPRSKSLIRVKQDALCQVWVWAEPTYSGPPGRVIPCLALKIPRSRAFGTGWPATVARPRCFLPASLRVAPEAGAQFLGVLIVQIYFIGAAIKAEHHGLGCFAAIQIILKDAYYSGYHPQTLSAMQSRTPAEPQFRSPAGLPLCGAHMAVAVTNDSYPHALMSWAAVSSALDTEVVRPPGSASHSKAPSMKVKNLAGQRGLCRAV
jgi:hypothetical protein